MSADGRTAFADELAACRELVNRGRVDEATDLLARLLAEAVDRKDLEGPLKEVARRALDLASTDPDAMVTAIAKAGLAVATVAAQRDRSAGIRAFNSFLERFGSLDGARSEVAAAIYNRAVALWDLGFGLYAAHDLHELMARFGADSSPETLIWVAIGLREYATRLLVRREEWLHNAAIVESLRLLDHMIEVFKDRPDPAFHDRVLAGWGLRVNLLYEAGRREEAAQDLIGLEAHSPHDLEAQRKLLSLRQLVEGERSLPGHSAAMPAELIGDDIDLIGQMALADSTMASALAFSNPHLLADRAHHAMSMLLERLSAGPLQEVVTKASASLTEIRERVTANPDQFILEYGPLERIRSTIGVEISAAAALEQVKELGIGLSLTTPYVDACSTQNQRWCVLGQWREALMSHRLLLSAVGATPQTHTSFELRKIAYLGFLEVARLALSDVPDPRVLREGVEIGEQLEAEARAAGDAVTACEALRRLGALYIDPYIAGRRPDRFVESLVRWYGRLREEVNDPTIDLSAPEWQMPEISAAIARGEDYLNRALAAAGQDQQGSILYALAGAALARRILGQPVVDEELRSLCWSAADALNDSNAPYLRLEMLLHLMELGGEVPLAALDRVLSYSIDEHVRRHGLNTTAKTLTTACELLLRIDPDRGLSLLENATTLRSALPEEVRLQLLRLEYRLLIVPRQELDIPVFNGDCDAAVAAVRSRTKRERWKEDDGFRALLWIVAVEQLQVSDKNAEDRCFETFASLLDNAPALGQVHRDALTYGFAARLTDAALRALGREEKGLGIRYYAAACGLFLGLDAPDAAIECLNLIEPTLKDGEPDQARAAVEGLGPQALRLELAAGPAGTDALQVVWRQVISVLHQNGGDANLLLAALQLANGHKFAAALRAGSSFAWQQDEDVKDWLAKIRAAERASTDQQDLAFQEGILSELTLLTPVNDSLDPRSTPSPQDIVTNLQRTVDRHIQDHLVAQLGSSVEYASLDDIRRGVPTDGVLMYLYLGRDSQGRTDLLTTLITSDVVWVASQPVTQGTVMEFTKVRVADRSRALDEIEALAWNLRAEVQSEPGPAPITSGGDAVLEAAFFNLLGPVVDMLEKLRTAGKTHLCVVPHRALHFVPIHLLGPKGKPIADSWILTYLPNLAMFFPSPPMLGATKRTSAVAIGFGFNGKYPFAVEPLPEAIDEAREVATLMGAQPVAEPEATEATILRSLQDSKYVHIATHGMHNVDAPAFQCLFVTPDLESDGRLPAYKLLDLDLRGLELITLSACETALGRYDSGGNLRGLPANILLRGASSLIGTLWPVGSDVSKAFFTTLYRALRGGQPKLGAFSSAQRTTRARYPQYRDWGAFYYLGNWREPGD